MQSAESRVGLYFHHRREAIFQTTSLRVLDLRKLEINLISFTKPTVFATVEGYGKPNFPNSPTYGVK